MYQITVGEIEQCIKSAEAAGVPDSEIKDLKEHLNEVRAGKFVSSSEPTMRYEIVGKKENSSERKREVVRVSTGRSFDGDFQGVNLKSLSAYQEKVKRLDQDIRGVEGIKGRLFDFLGSLGKNSNR
ncbi:hypothetical protein [Nostoc sp. UHCC 0252]|uniref:hypothetical protein n=1 Tax=Nostoc sp. UHCC 0252 TaxID=3110241 RepID=UPI002B21948D|nr:hypothetical protein [Nostoc sp. UHCC 0252]MEA5605459.1 hypothetical protein [Nostoc sp. UHCC 0252]